MSVWNKRHTQQARIGCAVAQQKKNSWREPLGLRVAWPGRMNRAAVKENDVASSCLYPHRLHYTNTTSHGTSHQRYCEFYVRRSLLAEMRQDMPNELARPIDTIAPTTH